MTSSIAASHIPVLLQEVIETLKPKPGEFFVDGTFGLGGHAHAIMTRIMPTGQFLGIDLEKTGENYADLPKILAERGLPKADGVLLDLGVSSEQLESSGRGFSFLRDEPLVMTYNSQTRPCYQRLRELSEPELAQILTKYGEERYARRIARAIKERERKGLIRTTRELAETVMAAVPRGYERGRIHPATRTFQALRIHTNGELENLNRFLECLPAVLARGGRIGIISFHSLEDRLVKNHFRDYARQGMLKLITKKPIEASGEEISKNPRSRSAKLRAAQMVK